MIRFARLALVTTLLLVPAEAVQAQAKNASGLWLGLGLGGGWGRIGCDLCTTQRDLAVSGFANFGGTLRKGLLVGAELNAWTTTQDEARETIGALGAVMYLYPRPQSSGLFVKGGVAVFHTRVTQDDDGIDATNVGLQMGAGYELHLTPGWSLTSYLNVLASSFGTLKAGDAVLSEDVTNTVVQFGVGIKRH